MATDVADDGNLAPVPPGAWRTLAIASAVVFMVSLEITIISLALPDIRAAFPDASDALVSWILTTYNIGVASLLLLAGRWADKAGRKKVFLVGLAFFAVGSVMATIAPSIEFLIAARGVQAVGGAIQYPAGLALVLTAFPPERRQSAIGIWGAMGALAAAVGPSFGAVLVNWLGWRSTFAINIPVAIVTLLLGRLWLKESLGEVAEGKVDGVSVPLASVGVGAIILGIVQAEQWGVGSPAQLITIAAGVVMVAGFVVRSRSHPVPLFDLALMRLRSFRIANLGMVAFTIAFFAWLVTLPTFMQDHWNWSVLKTGFAIAPGPLVAMVSSPPLGKLADRVGVAPVLMVGGAAGVVGMIMHVLFVTLEPNFFLMILMPGAFIGIAAGASFAMLVSAAMRDVPPPQFGMAGAGRTTLFQLTIAVAIAVGFGLTLGAVGAPDALDHMKRLWLVCAALYAAEFAIFALVYPRNTPGNL